MAQSPGQFATKLARLPGAVKADQAKAINARALVTKRAILTAAGSKTRQVRPSWVMVRIKDGTAEVRLRGGFAYLTELGSHLHPDGWEEVPSDFYIAMNTPEGPRASVMHPALRAREFWEEGLEAGRKPGHDAYKKITIDSITTALR